MNIVIGKFGKSVLFNETGWKHEGGDGEASQFYSCIAKYNPEINFYMIGKSDLSRLSNFNRNKLIPNNNIIDVWNGFNEKIHDKTEYCINKLKDIKIDAGILFLGPAGNANVPGKCLTIQKNHEGKIAKVLEMFENYCGPMVHYLNITGVPYFTLCTDSRYHPLRARDLYNLSKFSLSQSNDETKYVKHIVSYDDQTCKDVKIPMYYSRLETIFLYEKQKENILSYNKTIDLSIVMNQIKTDKFNKLQFLETYILNNSNLTNEFKNKISIYGNWEESVYKKYYQFKGILDYSKLINHLKSVKYTLINSIDNWVTAKYWESICYGVIPFLGKEFQEQKYISYPEILKLSSAKDFADKIEMLNNDNNFYETVLIELQESLKEEYFNGIHLNNIFKNGMKKLLDVDIESIDKIKKIKRGFERLE